MDAVGAAASALLQGLRRVVFPRHTKDDVLGLRPLARQRPTPQDVSQGHGGDDAVGEVILVGATLVLGLTALGLVVTWTLSCCCSPRPDPKAVFFAIFEDRIRGGFPSQTDGALATMLTGVNSVLRPSPESPCVLLLVGDPEAEATALRLAWTLAEAVQAVLRGWQPRAAVQSDVDVPGRDFAQSDDYWRLYEVLGRRLDEQRVAVVRDLQAVHPRAAAAITHLCDDIHAPFPQSVLILLLSPGDLLHPHPGNPGGPGCLGGRDLGGRGPDPAEAVVLAERCLVECWLARGPPPSSGAPPPAWSSPEVLPGVLRRLTGRAIIVQPEYPEDPEPDRVGGTNPPAPSPWPARVVAEPVGSTVS